MLPPRYLQPELMDDPSLDAELHEIALKGLARINKVSGTAAILWPPLKTLAQKLNRPLNVLDIATGGGEILHQLRRRGLAHGIDLRFVGIDKSPVAVEVADRNSTESAIRFVQGDALADPWPTSSFDVVMSSFFLHHLNETQAVNLLKKMRKAALNLVLVHDLERSRLGYVAAWMGTRILSRSPIVHHDGELSVQGAWTQREATELAQTAGLFGAQVLPRFPFRWLLHWSRPHSHDGHH